jgi:uncharacterized protein YdaU (DUF1376 family)
MEGAKLDKFFPLDLAWIAKASEDWDSKDAGPVLWVLFYLWPKGGRAPNDARKLATVAGISLKAWKGVRERVGTFFREDAGDLVQDFMVKLYAEKLAAFQSNKKKADAAIAARWEKGKKSTPSNTPGNTPSIPSSNTPGSTPASVRADLSYSDLKISSEREEGSSATAVPTVTVDEEITAALRAYPKTRKLPNGGETDVRIGENARDLAAAFLAAHPGYPLALAARYTAHRDKFPKDFANWLLDPPAADIVLAAYDAHLKARGLKRASDYSPADPASLRALVGAINSHAEGSPSHA